MSEGLQSVAHELFQTYRLPAGSSSVHSFEEQPEFENRGVVEALGPGMIRIYGDWTNNGIFRIRDQGILELNGVYSWSDLGTLDRIGGTLRVGGEVNNVGKTIEANATTGSLVLAGATIRGGTLAAADGEAWSYAEGNTTLIDVTLATDLALTNNFALDIEGELTLADATISLDSMYAWMRFSDSSKRQAVLGQGTIRLESGYPCRVSFSNLTLTEGITLEDATQGTGYGRLQGAELINEGNLLIRPGSSMTLAVDRLVNQGVITNEGRLKVNSDADSLWSNEGTIVLKPDATITFMGTTTVDGLGTWVDEGGVVEMAGVLDLEGNALDLESLPFANALRMRGGTLRDGRLFSSSDAVLDVPEAQYTSAIFDNITLATDLFLPGGASGATLRVENGLTLEDCTITMPEGAGISFQGDTQFLEGTGVLYAPNRAGTSSISHIAGNSLVIGSGITIRNGSESYRELQINFMENHGTIIAEAPGSLITIGRNVAYSTTPSWTNSGSILVQDGNVKFSGNYGLEQLGDIQHTGGDIVLNGHIHNEGVTIIQDPSTPYFKFRGTVHGGTIAGLDGVAANVGGQFDGVTLQGNAEGSVWLLSDLTLDDAIFRVEPNGTINLTSEQPISIVGHGEIVLDGPFRDTLIQTYNGSHLTIGAGITIRTGLNGGGSISRYDLPVINYGTLEAASPGQTLLVDGGLQNYGTLRSTSESLLQIDSDNWVNHGIIEAGHRRWFGGVTINSDSFINASDGLITGSGSLDMTAAPLVNQGTISPGPGVGSLVISGDLEMTDTSVLMMDLVSPQEIDYLLVLGDTTLAGMLELYVPRPTRLKVGATYTLVNIGAGREIMGKFDNPFDQVQVGDALFQIEYQPSSVSLRVLQIPEPGSVALLVLGCMACMAFRFRR